jgi:hypothetical protein
MTSKNIKDDLGYREPGPDRLLASWNDWYGFGFLFHMTGVSPREGKNYRWYCYKNECFNQFKLGAQSARDLNSQKS